MTLFNYISDNIDTIKKEIRIGLISSSTLKHWQMYARYDYYKRIGNKTTNALDFAAIDCGIKDRSWAWQIKKRMETEL